jgi:hypothetical protein
MRSFWDQIVQMITLIFPERAWNVDLLREKRVPTFYAGRIEFYGESGRAIYFAEILTAMIFGGIHCIAWSNSCGTNPLACFFNRHHIDTVAHSGAPFCN